jgi:multimeric flavodoxin WrbA
LIITFSTGRDDVCDVPRFEPLHFGMVVVGLGYVHAGQMTLDEITGGSLYGAATITGGDGSRLPTANEFQGALLPRP